jgi:hypothetical protein
MRITITAVLTLFATLALAQTDVDWKYYGRAVLNERMGKTELTCFYDENSIDHPTSGHVRVWTKCLDQNNMHSFDYHSDLGKKIIKAAAQKIVDLYAPPYAHIDDVSFETAKYMIGNSWRTLVTSSQTAAYFTNSIAREKCTAS